MAVLPTTVHDVAWAPSLAGAGGLSLVTAGREGAHRWWLGGVARDAGAGPANGNAMQLVSRAIPLPRLATDGGEAGTPGGADLIETVHLTCIAFGPAALAEAEDRAAVVAVGAVLGGRGAWVRSTGRARGSASRSRRASGSGESQKLRCRARGVLKVSRSRRCRASWCQHIKIRKRKAK